MKNYWIAKKRPQTKVSRKDQVDTKKEKKRQQFLYGGVYWTPCDRPVIFRRCDHNGLRAFETIWSASEMASVALSAERERRTENAFHMLLI